MFLFIATSTTYVYTSCHTVSLHGALPISLRANTFGMGVRFRSHKEWRQLFAEAGFHVLDMRTGRNERISPPLRGLLIKAIRRDSFVDRKSTRLNSSH